MGYTQHDALTPGEALTEQIAARKPQGYGRRPPKPSAVFPDYQWATQTPAQAKLDSVSLNRLRDFVGGHGCVVRHGYLVYSWGKSDGMYDIASAFKPILSTLMLMAVQEGKLPGPDAEVADYEPRLRELNGGKDKAMTFRHLASQTSGYGLSERPGEAYAYNDYALALYYDVLTEKVFGQSGNEILKTRLGEPLQFSDPYTFTVFGASNRPGRLGCSVRDLARIGLLYLRGGRWKDRQLLTPEHVRLATTSPIPATIPLTKAQDALMLAGQRSIGGTKNITSLGPGCYSFNWWLNVENPPNGQLYPALPPSTFIASGHTPRREMVVIPEWDLIVVWNEAKLALGDTEGAQVAMQWIAKSVANR
ncbi:serine hydrolase domain-containing protein [Larkinella bovis]|uniref:Serine hydrolase domain-containing protein n=1 Tax=Larkinella bovis TaxID=683041 RepID=A0ABW0I5I9_9BACT